MKLVRLGTCRFLMLTISIRDLPVRAATRFTLAMLISLAFNWCRLHSRGLLLHAPGLLAVLEAIAKGSLGPLSDRTINNRQGVWIVGRNRTLFSGNNSFKNAGSLFKTRVLARRLYENSAFGQVSRPAFDC